MSTHKYIDKICVAAILLALVITALFINGEKFGLQVQVDEDAERYEATDYFTSNDLNSADTDFSDAVSITLDGDSAKVSGNGAYVLDNTVTIVRSGYYTISGTTDAYRIVVDAEDYSKIWIQLNGVTIHCENDSALQIETADKVFLVLAEGTENVLTSGGEYSEEAVANGHDGTIFSREDLTITGAGSLTTASAYRHGIVSNDDLVITGGTITVEAAADGIHANDCFEMCNADITITAGDEGIQTDEAESYIYIESGTLNITTVDDSIKSAGDIRIQGGTFTISSGDDGIRSDTAIYIYDGVITINECYEGIEAKIIEVYGGDITIYPEDDGINANGGSGDALGMGGMNQPGGGQMPSMGEQSSNAETSEGTSETAGEMPDMSAAPNGGQMPPMDEQSSSTETPEETSETTGEMPDMSMAPDGGQMPSAGERTENTEASVPSAEENEAAAEDIISADETADTEEEEETYILVAGGSITIVNESAQDADGLDSNGSIYITGGTIRVSLVNSGSNNAIDFGSESGGIAQISGGTVIASGSYNMAESFDSSSEQVSLMYNVSGGVEAGTLVTLTDEAGNTILSETIPCSFSCIIISTPDLTLGSTYTLSFDEMEETITLEDVSSSFGDAQSSMFGGPMNFGGMQQRGENTMSQSGEMPDMDEFGEMPDMSAMPEMNGENGMHGGRPGDSGMQPFGNEEQSSDGTETAESAGQGFAPDPNAMGQTEEVNGETGSETPEGDGSSEQTFGPDQGTMGHPGEMNGGQSEAETDEEVTAEETETVSESVKWLMLGISSGVLLAGLLVVKLMKGKNIYS